jgi:hypothetical protein
MFLKHKKTGNLLEIIDMAELVDPCHGAVAGRYHAGEELQDPASYEKADLAFPSGEALPRCWTDPHYRK